MWPSKSPFKVNIQMLWSAEEVNNKSWLAKIIYKLVMYF